MPGLAAGLLFKVDPVTGNRTVLSDFSNSAQGPLGVDPAGVAVSPSGQIYVVDLNAGGVSPGLAAGLLFKVDPVTGNRTVLSDFSNVIQGPLGVDPAGVAVSPSGQIYVTDLDASGLLPGLAAGLLFQVDPVTGNRTVLSDFSNSGQGAAGLDPSGVAVLPSGQIYVTDLDGGGLLPGLAAGLLFKLDPVTGARTILSDFGDAAQGTTGLDPFGVAVSPSGQIYVTDLDGGGLLPGLLAGALFTVNQVTGNRTILSDFSNAAQGTTGLDPAGVAVVAFCGDGVLGLGEACDLGAQNGTASACCSATCTFVSAGTQCRAAAGVCDVAESCTGSSGSCPANGFKAAGTECRASAGQCDVAESCTGASVACPANGFKPNGTTCDDGSPTTGGETCNNAGACTGGVLCVFTISPTSASVPGSGGTGSVGVTTTTGCAWIATSNAPWITVTSGGSGSGNGSQLLSSR